jgi:hypothetical protein
MDILLELSKENLITILSGIASVAVAIVWYLIHRRDQQQQRHADNMQLLAEFLSYPPSQLSDQNRQLADQVNAMLHVQYGYDLPVITDPSITSIEHIQQRLKNQVLDKFTYRDLIDYKTSRFSL